MKRILLFIICFGLFSTMLFSQQIRSNSGEATFLSEAPLETIEASSSQLKGIHDLANNKFAYSIPIQSFDGFNSALQKEHFNTRYLHSDKHPNGSFVGKIVEKIDWSAPGKYQARAKGLFKVNGVEHSRVIVIQIDVKNDVIEVSSDFEVFLENHNISIPILVESNISERIEVTMKASFLKPE